MKQVSRREFLTKAAVATGGCAVYLLLGPQGAADASHPAPAGDYDWEAHRYAYLIDTVKCIGCGICVKACKAENLVPDGFFRTWIERYEVDPLNPEHPTVTSPNGGKNGWPPSPESNLKSFFVPKLCNHCSDSPCVQVCPVGATFDSPDGVVATRFYLPSSGTPGVTPSTWNGGWDGTGGPQNIGTLPCAASKASTSLTTSGLINSGNTGPPNTQAAGRWVSPPLDAQTINSGTTLTGYLRCYESAGTANATLAVYIGLVNADGSAGSTVIALSASDNTSATPPEMGTALASRQWLNASEASLSVSGNVSVTKGQRLVIEVGARFSNTVTSRGAYFRYGDASANDFTSDNDTTNDYNPWVELSQTLVFATIATPDRGAVCTVD